MLMPKRVKRSRVARGRMKGNGYPEYWVAVFKPGRVMFEMAGIPEDMAREALRLASYKLPVKTKIVKKEIIEEGGDNE